MTTPTTSTPPAPVPVPALIRKQLLKGILQNQGTESCLSYEKPKDETDDVIPIVLVSACSAITIQIRSIGNEGNPVCIFHLDDEGNMRILDFSDEDTFFFTTLVGSTYPENQQFTMEIGWETYRFKHGDSPKYLSVEKKPSSVEGDEDTEVLVLRQLETDRDRIKFQEFVLVSPTTPTVTPVVVPVPSQPIPAPAPVPAPATKRKGFFAKLFGKK